MTTACKTLAAYGYDAYQQLSIAEIQREMPRGIPTGDAKGDTWGYLQLSDAVGRLAPLNLIQRRSAAEQPELWGVYRALIILANGRVYGARYA